MKMQATEIIDQLDAIVGIVCRSNQMIIGSGFYISRNLIVTAKHVLREMKSCGELAVLCGDDLRSIDSISEYDGSGFVIISVSGSSSKWFTKFAKSEVGLPVAVLGYPKLQFTHPFAGVRIVLSNVMTSAIKHGSGILFEIQGEFPLGFSGSVVVSQNADAIGLLDGCGSWPINDSDQPTFNFGVCMDLDFTNISI